MGARAVTFTYRDYLCLDDDRRHEVLEGDLVMVPAPFWQHQTVSTRLFVILHSFVQARGLGVVRNTAVDVVLSEENVVQPDLFFIARGRAGIIQERGVFGPPDLAVEIVSPGRPERDEVVKRLLYGKYGVREYWIVDPMKKTVEVLALTDSGLETLRAYPEGSRVQSPLLAGLSFDPADIFLPEPAA